MTWSRGDQRERADRRDPGIASERDGPGAWAAGLRGLDGSVVRHWRVGQCTGLERGKG
jgi:hypothetical protein